MTKARKVCSVMAVTDPAIEIVKDAVIPLFGDPVAFEYPGNIPFAFLPVVNQYKHLFRSLPGSTTSDSISPYNYTWVASACPTKEDSCSLQVNKCWNKGL